MAILLQHYYIRKRLQGLLKSISGKFVWEVKNVCTRQNMHLGKGTDIHSVQPEKNGNRRILVLSSAWVLHSGRWSEGPEWAVCVFAFPQSRMKYEKVHSIYNRLLAIEDIDPTLVRSSLVPPHAHGLAPSACTGWGSSYRIPWVTGMEYWGGRITIFTHWNALRRALSSSVSFTTSSEDKRYKIFPKHPVAM